MAVAVTATIPFDRVYSTTLAAERSELAMEIVQSNPTFWHFYRQGAVQYEGGTEVRVPVAIQSSANVGPIGLYSTFTTAAEDGPDKARYNTWYKNRGSLVVDNTELAQNRGRYEIVNLLKAKTAIMKVSLVNELSRQLHINNTAEPLAIDGLFSDGTNGFIEDAAPAAQAGSPGGIRKATFANWRNQRNQIAAFGDDGLDQWELTYHECSTRGTHPDIMPTDSTVYRFFKRLVAPNQRERDNSMWDAGFRNLLFNGTPVVPDEEMAGTGRTFMLTTTGRRVVNDFNLKPQDFEVPGGSGLATAKHVGVGLGLAILKSDDFRFTSFMTPPNSDVILAHCYLSCQLVTSSMARQGITTFSGTVQF